MQHLLKSRCCIYWKVDARADPKYIHSTNMYVRRAISLDKLICLFLHTYSSTSWYVSFHKLKCLFWQVDMSLFTSWYVSFDKLICLFSQVDMSLLTSWYVSFHKLICLFSQVDMSLFTRWYVSSCIYSRSHLGWHFRMLFQNSISKLERLFSLKRGKRVVRALSLRKCHPNWDWL